MTISQAASCVVLLLVVGLIPCQSGHAQQASFNTDDHPGLVIYQEHCATCHGNRDFPRAHTLEALQTMTADTLEYALNEGVMATQGSGLTLNEQTQLIDFLAVQESANWVADLMCSEDQREVDLSGYVALNRVGIDKNNSRAMSAQQAGLSTADMANLELAWTIGFPDTGALRSSPVLVGNTLFYAASGTRKVFALDSHSGCAKWVFNAPTRLRSSLTYSRLGKEGPDAILYGDAQGFVYALEARSGNLIWSIDVRSHGLGVRISGAPIVEGDRVIVSISNSGVGAAANPDFECCVGHGAVTALNASTGEILWEYHTMPQAQYTGEVNSRGVRLRGPSGAPIWTTPTIDTRRGTIYVTTGENTSHPATDTSDAVIALDIETGEQKWLFQGLALDVWNMACGRNRNTANCPNQRESALKDYDFGGPAILVERDAGDILLAGQKSGDLWALDPDNGEVLWNQRIGDGTALGGNHWGITTDGERVYLPINDPGVARPGFTPRPGMYSFFVATGESSWSYPLRPDCDDGRGDRVNACQSRFGLSAAPLLVDGALISAGIDGRLFIFDKENGEILFQYDTVRNYSTVNGVAARGGSIDSHSIAAGGGMLFIGSGYGSFGQTPGNALLAFRPRSE
ncbi:MAG: PQQ-binding-like beta-propeller repeat protein [Proteobacteria bacterium]|nr:PQQ-binding-like beta-propeller repeat protein [Pseudomonadota bacterium]